MSATKELVMSAAQFDRLRKIIYDRSGIHFPENKKYVLESRLSRRLMDLEIDDYDQYTSFLTMGPYKDDEFQEMFNFITINETSFFRNEPQLEVFEKRALPALLEARSATKRLRIWSAACSTGEEPFTIAIMLHRTLGIRLADWTIEILGSDISEKALGVAAEGKYTDYAMRSTAPLIAQRYFRKEGLYWIIDPGVRSMARFEVHNLKDRLAAKRHGKWDAIFCRNVMIYFDDPMKKQVVGTFAEQLADDGWLFIGHSETLRGVSEAFEQVNVPQGFCYRKTKAAGPSANAGIKLAA